MELAVGGGVDDDGAGGFTGGAGEKNKEYATNGLGGYGTGWYGGGGYYSEGTIDPTATRVKYGARIGGEGASCLTEYGGDGGIAGNGGSIKVSTNATIYAYNGDRITDGDYDTVYYEYEYDGTQTDTIAQVLQKNDNKNTKFIPAKIYAQDGILREVYKVLTFWGKLENRTYSYFYTYLSSSFLLSESQGASKTDVMIRAATTCSTTGYTNPETGSIQGIGSGAGYIEISNGTYTIDSSMN